MLITFTTHDEIYLGFTIRKILIKFAPTITKENASCRKNSQKSHNHDYVQITMI